MPTNIFSLPTEINALLTIGGTDNLAVTSTGNVGIGTTNPGAKLEVFGTGNTLRLDSAANGSKEILFRNVGTGTATIKTDGDLKLYVEDAGKNILFDTTGGEKMRIQADGNVGIGTASPVSTWLSGFDPSTGNGNFKLTSEGWIVTPYLTGLASYFSTQGARPIIWADASGTSIQSWDNSSTDGVSVKSSNGTTRLFVREDGNVGIGTTSPTAKLHVAGASIIADGNTAIDPDVSDYSVVAGAINDGGGWGVNSGIGGRAAGAGDTWAIGHNGTSLYMGIGNGTATNSLSTFLRADANGTIALTAYGAGYLKSDANGNITVDADVIEDTLDTVTTRNPVTANEIQVGGITVSDTFPYVDFVDTNSFTDTNDRFRVRAYGDAGAIQWYDDSSSTVNGLMHFASTGNVGVGTTDPSFKLHVAGDILLEGSGTPIFRISDTGNGGGGGAAGIIQFSNTAGNSIGIGYTGNDKATSDLLISTNAASTYGGYLGLDAAAIADPSSIILDPKTNVLVTNGNVGIGTTSPDYKLDVAGDIRINAGNAFTDLNIKSDRTSGNIGGVNFVDGNDAIKGQVYGNADGSVKITSGGTSVAMTIIDGGNVGIGTASPSGKLHIQTDASSEFIFTGASTSGYTTTFHMDNTGLDIGHNSTGRSLNLKTGSLDRLTITGAGNVGIGTTSIANNLQVGSVGSTGYSNNNIAWGDGTRAGAIYINATASWLYASADQIFAPGSGEKVRITSTGNVGIGTTSPSEKLHVDGNSLFDGNVLIGDAYTQPSGSTWTTSNSQLILGGSHNADFNSGTKAKLVISGYDNDGSTIYPIVVEDENGLDDFWIKNRASASSLPTMYFAGNVGIGTTSPSTNLEIGAAVNVAPKLRLTLNDSGSSINPGQEYGSLQWHGNDGQGNGVRADIRVFGEGTSGETYMTLGTMPAGTSNATNALERVRIDSNGNVGIGTTGPANKFHVADTGTGVTVRIQNSTAGSASILRFQALSSTSTQEYADIRFDPQAGAGALIFRNPFNSERMRIADNGNVGIGYTSPSYKLDVNGTIRGTNVSPSDARLKENVETIPNALERVNAIRGVAYNKIGEQKRSIGVVAQELLEVLPEVVHEDNKGMYSVDYGSITGILIEAIKEQQKQIDELKAMIASK